MKYKHYQPNADFVLYIGEEAAVENALNEAKDKAEAEGLKVEIIDYKNDVEKAARSFFMELRAADRKGADLILAAAVSEEGLGEAVMDRMRKASAGKIVYVN